MKRLCLALLLAALAAGATAPESAALDRISPASLRSNLSFLASDALEGRGTPSKGLDVAAEFIASRFREAGLEPVSPPDSYFQIARFAELTPHLDDFTIALKSAGVELKLTKDDARARSLGPLDLHDAPVLLLPENGLIPPVEDKIVAGPARRYGTEPMLRLLQSRRPSLIVLFSGRRGRTRATSYLQNLLDDTAPVIRIGNQDALAALNIGREMTLSVHLAAPARRDSELRNVAGILRGSDPALQRQFIILSAHYDHLGIADGGRIYHGANDNGSGTVSVIEIAAALAALPVHPKRSILFLAFFGEEEGLLGSFYYASHPLVPLKDTVADINLEQMGRTDDDDQKRVASFGFTGPDFSDLPALMQAAAGREGVSIYTRKGADDYFDRSDNYALALAGVVAHTVCVAFEYPDYHALGDDWQKIDYNNMATVDRGIAAGILTLAGQAAVPRWSESTEAAQYRESGK